MVVTFTNRVGGWVSVVNSNRRTIWIADAHRDYGRGFVVHADEKLNCIVESESAIRACGELVWQANAIFAKLAAVPKDLNPGYGKRAAHRRDSKHFDAVIRV